MESPHPTIPEPVVRLTQEAAEHVQAMLAEQTEHAGKSMRIYVEEGGCSGLQYGMVFDQPREGDHRATFFEVELLVDPVSAGYLKGTVIDYVDSLNDGGFKVLNPQARQSCGCGRSFES